MIRNALGPLPFLSFNGEQVLLKQLVTGYRIFFYQHVSVDYNPQHLYSLTTNRSALIISLHVACKRGIYYFQLRSDILKSYKDATIADKGLQFFKAFK